MKLNVSDLGLTFFISTLPILIFSYLFFFQIISLPFWLNLILWIVTGILCIPLLLLFWHGALESYICLIFQIICAEFLFFTAPALKTNCWILTSILFGFYLLLSLVEIIRSRMEIQHAENSSNEAWTLVNFYRDKSERQDAIARKIKDSLR